MAIFPGRRTARLDGDFVVFLIGMRFNRPWKVRSWRVFMAMRPMVKELEANPRSGFLHAEYGFMFGGPALDQPALRELILRFARLLEALPELVEVDLNPVRVLRQGCVVLDARMRAERRQPRPRVKTW